MKPMLCRNIFHIVLNGTIDATIIVWTANHQTELPSSVGLLLLALYCPLGRVSHILLHPGHQYHQHGAIFMMEMRYLPQENSKN